MRLSRRKKKWLKAYFDHRHGAAMVANKQSCRDIYLAVISYWQKVKFGRRLKRLPAYYSLEFKRRIVYGEFGETT